VQAIDHAARDGDADVRSARHDRDARLPQAGQGAFLALTVSDPYGFPTTLSILDRYG